MTDLSPAARLLQFLETYGRRLIADGKSAALTAFFLCGDEIIGFPAHSQAAPGDRQVFAALTALASEACGSDASAVIFEAWHLFGQLDDDDLAEAARLRRDGKPLGDHPKASEALCVVVESENEQIYRVYPIERAPGLMPTLGDNLAGPEKTAGGILTGIHMKNAERGAAENRSLVAEMRKFFDEAKAAPLAAEKPN